MTKPSVVKLQDVWVTYHETLALKGVVELVYGKIVLVGGHRLSLRCYTAVDPNGESREKGTDAIRLQLFHKVQDQIVAVGKPQKCLRVESWRDNIGRAIGRITDAENLRVCPACGHPMVVRRNGATGQEFLGCSAFRLTGCKGRTPPTSATVDVRPEAAQQNSRRTLCA